MTVYKRDFRSDMTVASIGGTYVIHKGNLATTLKIYLKGIPSIPYNFSTRP